jgi:hypothetical protein
MVNGGEAQPYFAEAELVKNRYYFTRLQDR